MYTFFWRTLYIGFVRERVKRLFRFKWRHRLHNNVSWATFYPQTKGWAVHVWKDPGKSQKKKTLIQDSRCSGRDSNWVSNVTATSTCSISRQCCRCKVLSSSHQFKFGIRGLATGNISLPIFVTIIFDISCNCFPWRIYTNCVQIRASITNASTQRQSPLQFAPFIVVCTTAISRENVINPGLIRDSSQTQKNDITDILTVRTQILDWNQVFVPTDNEPYTE